MEYIDECLKDHYKKTFKKIYKGCKLVALQFNGFSHKIFYLDENNRRHIDEYSECAPELYREGVHSFNTDRAKLFFFLTNNVSNSPYQNNPLEVIYISPSEL